MTHFEHYKAVAEWLTTTWAQTPIKMRGEVIDIEPPFIVLDIYGVGTEGSFTHCGNINGNRVECYDVNRGKAHKLVSDVQQHLIGKQANGITIEDPAIDGAIVLYEKDLFQGVVKFTTRS